MDDAKIIAAFGGPAALAAELGFKKGGTQRVFNWTKRGIPAAVKVARPDLFLADVARTTVRMGDGKG